MDIRLKIYSIEQWLFGSWVKREVVSTYFITKVSRCCGFAPCFKFESECSDKQGPRPKVAKDHHTESLRVFIRYAYVKRSGLEQKDELKKKGVLSLSVIRKSGSGFRSSL
jgi:hypothetical protein